MLGARQAGAPGFRFARLNVHAGLLARAREEARAALEHSERLIGEENRGLRLLLYLFERDEAAKRGGRRRGERSAKSDLRSRTFKFYGPSTHNTKIVTQLM